jgi:hypothetical protein
MVERSDAEHDGPAPLAGGAVDIEAGTEIFARLAALEGLAVEDAGADQPLVVHYGGFRIALADEAGTGAVLASLVVGDTPQPGDPEALRLVLHRARDIWLRLGMSLAVLRDGRIVLSARLDPAPGEVVTVLGDQVDALAGIAAELRLHLTIAMVPADGKPRSETTQLDTWLKG